MLVELSIVPLGRGTHLQNISSVERAAGRHLSREVLVDRD